MVYRCVQLRKKPPGRHEMVLNMVMEGGRSGRVARVLHPRVVSRVRRMADRIIIGSHGNLDPKREDQLCVAARCLDKKVRYRDRLRRSLSRIEAELR